MTRSFSSVTRGLVRRRERSVGSFAGRLGQASRGNLLKEAARGTLKRQLFQGVMSTPFLQRKVRTKLVFSPMHGALAARLKLPTAAPAPGRIYRPLAFGSAISGNNHFANCFRPRLRGYPFNCKSYSVSIL